MINVTRAFFPPIEDYQFQVRRIWENQWLTNRGALVLELEEKLKEYLGTNNILVTNNGTLPIQIALKLLGGQGEIITTPFSYVATTASIIWENCKPVFVDIHPDYLSIDETKIEDAITKNTTAILATHVFGNPCHVEAIEAIAKKHSLKVIYDGAHSFGTKYKGKSIFDYGDVSTCSFHATKLFHTGEGGAVFCNDKALMDKIYYSHNFGHDGPLAFHGLGINAKISELQAAMGLAILPFMESIIRERREITDFYSKMLTFGSFRKLTIRESTQWNYSYYPIIFENEQELLACQKRLNENEIFPRRYFYPSLNNLPYVSGQSMPVSEKVAASILCLPLYIGLEKADQDKICKLINQL